MTSYPAAGRSTVRPRGLKMFLEGGDDAPKFLEGERALARGVIQKALSDLRSAIRREHGGRSYGFSDESEVSDWFFNPRPSQEVSFTFEYACEVLGRDIEQARILFEKRRNLYIRNAERKGKVLRKLSFGQVYEVRALIEKRESTLAIARRYKLDDSSIRKIRSGRMWKMTPSFHEVPLAVEAQDEALERTAVAMQKVGKPLQAWRRGGFSHHIQKAHFAFRRWVKQLEAGNASLPELEDVYQRIGMAIQLKREAIKEQDEKAA